MKKPEKTDAAPALPSLPPFTTGSFEDIMAKQKIIFDMLVKQHEHLVARRTGSDDDIAAPMLVSDSGSSDEDEDDDADFRAGNQNASFSILPSSLHDGIPDDLLYSIPEDVHPSEFELLSSISLSFYSDHI
jgi:hypothetical protein